MKSGKQAVKQIEQDNLPIVVVGGGPTGLAAAMGACKKGYRITLINKYPLAIRRQRIKVDWHAVSLFNEFADANDEEDQTFLRKLTENKNTVSVAAIERFWKRKCDAYVASGQLRLIESNQGSFQDIDCEKKKVTLKMKEGGLVDIPFQHVVDATGSARVVLRKMAEHAPAINVERKMPIPADMLLSQGTAIFFLNEAHKNEKYKQTIQKKRTPIYIVRFTKVKKKEMIKRFAWFSETHYPRAYIICDSEHKKFYVGGEAPPIIQQMTVAIRQLEEQLRVIKEPTERQRFEGEIAALHQNRRKKMQEYFRFVLSCQFGVPEDETLFKVTQSRNEHITLRLRDLAVHANCQFEEVIKLIEDQASKLKLSVDELKIQVASKAVKYMVKYKVDCRYAIEAVCRKYDLQATQFELKLTQANAPLHNLAGSAVVGLGDAIQSPHFHYAHGVVDAMRSVKRFLFSLPEASENKKFKFRNMRRFVNNIQKKHARRMKKESNSKRMADARKEIVPKHLPLISVHSGSNVSRLINKPDSQKINLADKNVIQIIHDVVLEFNQAQSDQKNEPLTDTWEMKRHHDPSLWGERVTVNKENLEVIHINQDVIKTNDQNVETFKMMLCLFKKLYPDNDPEIVTSRELADAWLQAYDEVYGKEAPKPDILFAEAASHHFTP